MKNRFDLSELYTRFIQLFEISGIEDVFDDDTTMTTYPMARRWSFESRPKRP